MNDMLPKEGKKGPVSDGPSPCLREHEPLTELLSEIPHKVSYFNLSLVFLIILICQECDESMEDDL